MIQTASNNWLEGTLTDPRPNSKRCASYTMFNRHGGQSEGVFSSLNVGFNVGDRESDVLENCQKIKNYLGVSFLLSARQIHGVEVYSLKSPLSDDFQAGCKKGCDALITGELDVGLMIQHADCQAVLFYDPEEEIIAAAHSGWRGSVQNILYHVVKNMGQKFGSRPENIQAVISPSLGPCCAEFINYSSELPEEFYPFMVSANHFDFWRISTSQLIDAGLQPGNIKSSQVCTACSTDYYSYRRACVETAGITGRNCSVISLGKTES